MTPTGRDSDKFMLRLPDGMRDKIADEAKKNGRSMNAEIITRLETSFSSEIDQLTRVDPQLDLLVSRVLDRMQELRLMGKRGPAPIGRKK